MALFPPPRDSRASETAELKRSSLRGLRDVETSTNQVCIWDVSCASQGARLTSLTAIGSHPPPPSPSHRARRKASPPSSGLSAAESALTRMPGNQKPRSLHRTEAESPLGSSSRPDRRWPTSSRPRCDSSTRRSCSVARLPWPCCARRLLQRRQRRCNRASWSPTPMVRVLCCSDEGLNPETLISLVLPSTFHASFLLSSSSFRRPPSFSFDLRSSISIPPFFSSCHCSCLSSSLQILQPRHLLDISTASSLASDNRSPPAPPPCIPLSLPSRFLLVLNI